MSTAARPGQFDEARRQWLLEQLGETLKQHQCGQGASNHDQIERLMVVLIAALGDEPLPR